MASVLALGNILHAGLIHVPRSGPQPPSCTTRAEPNVDCVTAINTWCKAHDPKPADDCVDQLTLNYLED